MVDRDTSILFSNIWKQRQQHLYALCLQWTGRREDAEDALGRLAIKALEGLAEPGVNIASYPAWLTRLARNICMDAHRARASYRRAIERLEREGNRASEPASEHLEDEQLRRELVARVRRAIDGLPLHLREPCRLRFLEEMPYQDIAERLTLSNDTVRKRIQHARDLLHEDIGRHDRDRQWAPKATPQKEGRSAPSVTAAPQGSSGAGAGLTSLPR